MTRNQKDFILMLEKADLRPQINYSTSTEKFFVSSKLYIKKGDFLFGICEHRDTPEEAVDAYRDALKGNRIVADVDGVRRDFLILQ